MAIAKSDQKNGTIIFTGGTGEICGLTLRIVTGPTGITGRMVGNHLRSFDQFSYIPPNQYFLNCNQESTPGNSVTL